MRVSRTLWKESEAGGSAPAQAVWSREPAQRPWRKVPGQVGETVFFAQWALMAGQTDAKQESRTGVSTGRAVSSRDECVHPDHCALLR